MSSLVELPFAPVWVHIPWLEKIVHWKEVRRSNQEFLEKVRDVFQKRLQISDGLLFQRTWDRAAARVEWKAGDPLTEEAEERIEAALRETLLYSGRGIKTTGSGPVKSVHEIVQYVLGNGSSNAEYRRARYEQAALLRTVPGIMQSMRQEFQQVLSSAALQIPSLSSENERVFKTFVHNIIALLPYCYPEEGEEFFIPQKVGGEWRVCKYRIDRELQLTPTWFSSPVVAYGLISEEGPPLLTFLGTTFPSEEAFVATVLSDFTPGLSVGHAPYLIGRAKIEEWLAGKGGVRLFGASLGGSMAFQVLRHHRSQIDSVDAFNPPGLYPWSWPERFDEGQEVNIYCQENDFISSMGMFPEGSGVSVFHVHAAEREGVLKAHSRVYAGGDEVTILKGDASFENRRAFRRVLIAVHMIAGVFLGFLPALFLYLLYSLTVRPIQYAHNKLLPSWPGTC